MRGARRVGPEARVLASEIKRSMRVHWLALVAIVLLMGVAVLLDLVPPLVLRNIVDNKLSANKPDGLWALSAVYMGALVLAQTAGFVQNYLTAVVGQSILLVSIRLLVVSHLEALPPSYFDRTAIGDTISRTTADVDAVNTLFTSGVIGMVTGC